MRTEICSWVTTDDIRGTSVQRLFADDAEIVCVGHLKQEFVFFAMAFLEIREAFLAVSRSLCATLLHRVVQLLLDFARLGIRERLIVAFNQVSVRLIVQEDDLFGFGFVGFNAAISVQFSLFNVLDEGVVLLLLPI